MRSISRLLDLLTRPLATGLLLLILATTTLPIDAACFTTGRTQGTGVGFVGYGGRSLAPDGEDLLVSLEWPEELNPDLTLVLTTPSGVLVGSWLALQDPGQFTEQRLDGALAQVATLGFQYILRIESDEEVHAQTAFRVAVDCADGPCRYQLLGGLEGGPITVSEALWNALAEARDAGAPDLLAEVRSLYPELDGEIPGFAWQLQQSEPEILDGCSCRWVGVQGLAPATPVTFGPRTGNFPRHRYGGNPEGAHFRAGVQSMQGAVGVTRAESTGRTLFGIQLLCTRYTGEVTNTGYPTDWPTMPFLKLEERGLESCPAPCTPAIEYDAQVDGCAAGTALSREGFWGRAFARVAADLKLGTQSQINSRAKVRVQAANNELIQDVDFFFEGSSITLPATGALADLETSARLQANASSLSVAQRSYGFASASLKYRLAFLVPPSCDGIPTHGALIDRLEDPLQEGGVAMERWDP